MRGKRNEISDATTVSVDAVTSCLLCSRWTCFSDFLLVTWNSKIICKHSGLQKKSIFSQHWSIIRVIFGGLMANSFFALSQQTIFNTKESSMRNTTTVQKNSAKNFIQDYSHVILASVRCILHKHREDNGILNA